MKWGYYMKFGIIEFTPIKERIKEKYINIGDMIQSEAIYNIYKKMEIKDEQILEININDLSTYNGEYVILPININLSFNWVINVLPLPDKIIPVFLGLSYFSSEELPSQLCEYFKYYGPVGCRDEATLNLLRSNNIPAYLYGCITATYPLRPPIKQTKKILCVDVPKSFKKNIPNDIIKNYSIEYLSHIFHGEDVLDISEVKRIYTNLMAKYQTEVDLVITSRLHCMSPCLAMGIPVIAVTENCSPRLGWIDKFIQIYTPETYDSIDWTPKPIYYEDIKEIMIEIAIDKIKSTYDKYEKICDLSQFYEQRKKSNYGNFYYTKLKQLPKHLGEDFKYIIWGTGQIGINAFNVISSKFPKSKMVAAVDSFCEGNFFGLEIQKPNVIKNYQDTYVFIATYSGESYAIDILRQLGKRNMYDFMSLATTTG